MSKEPSFAMFIGLSSFGLHKPFFEESKGEAGRNLV